MACSCICFEGLVEVNMAIHASHRPMSSAMPEEVQLSSQKAFADLLAPIGATSLRIRMDWTGGQLTLGSTLGFAAGVALRTVGRWAAVGVGCTFCVIQGLEETQMQTRTGLAYHGYIEVNWRALDCVEEDPS